GAGFDKVLQYRILSLDKRTAFAPMAVVYHEKTAHNEQLVKQRARWINTWFKYFGCAFRLLAKGTVNSSSNQLLFGFTLLRPPLFMLLIVSLIFLIINLFISPWLSVVWGVGLSLFVFGFFVALKVTGASDKIYNSLYGIPKFVFWQLKSLVLARNANQLSVATKHIHHKEEVK